MKGKVLMVTDKMGNKKHENIIGKEVTFNEDIIKKGSVAYLYVDEDGMYCRTSKVVDIHSDSQSLTIYTLNSVFYIEKQ